MPTDLFVKENQRNANFIGLAKNQNQQLQNLQLNQPSVMKNSTAAGYLSKAANINSINEDNRLFALGLSSQVLINAGK